MAQHFGLSLPEAEAVLEGGRGVITPQMPMAEIRRLMPLLAALGVRATLRTVWEGPIARSYDLSLRLLDADALAHVVIVLNGLGVVGAWKAAAFAGPTGLEMNDLTEGRAKGLALALGKLEGLQVTLCSRAEASYDLFASRNRIDNDLVKLRHHLSLLGCNAKGPGAALATGLRSPKSKSCSYALSSCRLFRGQSGVSAL